jgi:hypothetical protein
MSLFYKWLAARLDSLETSEFFKAANGQTQQDLRDSYRLLRGDLAVLKRRSEHKIKDPRNPEIPPKKYSCNQWIWGRWSMPLDKWEAFAFECFNANINLDPVVLQFFDDYVHDSFEGFYLAGEVTEYDKRAKVAKALEEKLDDLNKFDRKILALTKRFKDIEAKAARGEKLNSEEDAILRQAKDAAPYPIMTDEDTADMGSFVITTQTWTRREGGGYFLRRGYYPKDGWLFWKKPRVDENLERSAQYIRGLQKSVDEEYLVAWSDNIARDVHQNSRISAV